VRFDPAFFLIFPVFVPSVVVRECAHGLMALQNGDTTARDRFAIDRPLRLAASACLGLVGAPSDGIQP
jgi:hypothetical protein